MKVVKQISTGNIIHREIPDFLTGNGIINASKIYNISSSDLNEVEILQAEWDAYQSNLNIIEEQNNTKEVALSGSEKMLFRYDSVREKWLSEITPKYEFYESSLMKNDWLKIGNSSNANVGHIMLYDGTITKITCYHVSAVSNPVKIMLYINDSLIDPNFISPTPDLANETMVNTSVNVDFSAGDKIRLRATSTGSSIGETFVTIYIQWRIT